MRKKTIIMRESMFNKIKGSKKNQVSSLPEDVVNQMIKVEDESYYVKEDKGTRVVFIANKKSEVYGFMIYGQTGYAVKPFDIVSSCLVTMSHFVVTTIDKYTDDKYDYNESEADKFQAFVLPSLKHGRASEISKVVLKNMVTEILEIERQYSDYINVYIRWDY